MREHDVEEGEGEVVADSEEDDVEIGADSSRTFSREKTDVFGWRGIDSIAGEESRLDERDLIVATYVETKEPRECSQADAFNVIEHLVALDDMELLEQTNSAKVVKEKSPCLSTVKGVLALARRMGHASLAGNMGRFEWVDVDHCEESEDGDGRGKWKNSKIKCRDVLSEVAAFATESMLEAEIKCPVGHSVEACTGVSEINFLRGLDGSLDMDASGLQLNAHLVNRTTEYDIGFTTQMAAEAMEALSRAPSSSSCGSFSPGLQADRIPTRQSCSKSRYGSSSTKTKSCSKSARLTRPSKGMDDLLKSDSCLDLEKDLGRSSLTILSQSIGKGKAAISRRTKKSDAVRGPKTSSKNIVQNRTIKEANHNAKGYSLTGWPRSKIRLGRTKRRYDGDKANASAMDNVGRPDDIVSETDLFDDIQLLKHQKLKPATVSWCYAKRKRTRIDSRRPGGGVAIPQLSASQALFKDKLASGSNRETSSQNSLGTLTVCLSNDDGVYSMEKDKRPCPIGAHSINDLLPQEKIVDTISGGRPTFLMEVEVEDAKYYCNPKNLDGYRNNMRLASLASNHRGDLEMKPEKRHLNTFWRRELNRLGDTNIGLDYKTKDLRRPRHMANVRVLFSLHLEAAVIRQQKKVISRLAIPLAVSMDDATHFVADKFVRTRNMLEAIALGKPVVTPLWLESCLQAGYLIAEKNFILRDEKMEKKMAFDMPSSLMRARQHPLLEGKRVVITPNIGPDKEMILRLIKAVCGQAIETSDPAVIQDENSFGDELLVLSCAEDIAVYSRFLEMGVAVYSSEFLLNGLVTQKIDYERYMLHGSEVDQSSSIRRRSKNNS